MSKIAICQIRTQKYGDYVQAYFPDKDVWIGVMVAEKNEGGHIKKKGILLAHQSKSVKKIGTILAQRRVPKFDSNNVDAKFDFIEIISAGVSIQEVAVRIKQMRNDVDLSDKDSFVNFVRKNAQLEIKNQVHGLKGEDCLVVDVSTTSKEELRRIKMMTFDEIDNQLADLMKEDEEDMVLSLLQKLKESGPSSN